MANILDIHDCYGCGVCAIICSKKIIEIKLNNDGFYEPFITDTNSCTNCGLCKEVCAYCHDVLSTNNVPIKSYASWSNDNEVRRKCSSGGIGFEIGRKLISRGYKVCGVKYNVETNRAEHYIANTVEELIPSIGSKYIQSYTVDGFKAINRKEKYLVTGTPCQIDSFRRFIRKFRCEDNFVLMDFFCHGVPSMLAWNKYIKWAETKVGKLTYVSWRNKFTGWHDSWAMSIDGEQTTNPVNWHDSYNILIKEKKGFLNSRLSQGDMFYKLFLSDVCLGKACYEKCKYKYNKSAADIRIGDLWGNTYKDNEEGVSGVSIFTDKGLETLNQCNITLKEHSFEIIAEGQMKKMPQKHSAYYKTMTLLRDEKNLLPEIMQKISSDLFIIKLCDRLKHPKRTLKGLIRRLNKKK